MPPKRDHGGGLDAAIALYGGDRAGWIDLSTGINPVPYPVGDIAPEAWTALPDEAAMSRLLAAARDFWAVPDAADVIATPGASAMIAALPRCLAETGTVLIRKPTYNEWEAAFRGAGWHVTNTAQGADAAIFVHPNNPDGLAAPVPEKAKLGGMIFEPSAPITVYDESFADGAGPLTSFVAATGAGGSLVVKSFGKFWGLAGLRLGFAIGEPALTARIAEALGPWPVSGPALQIGAQALSDSGWAAATRTRLAQDRRRLDALMQPYCAEPQGTDLFSLYALHTAEATAALHLRLAQHRIWSRVFPYNARWLRLGLPGSEADWARLTAALA